MQAEDDKEKRNTAQKRVARGLRAARERLFADVRAWRVGLIAFILYWTLSNLIFHAYCPLRLLTGVPCPGCGLTRAGASLLLLEFDEAWHYHPLIYAIAPALLAAAVCRYLLARPLPYGRAIAIFILAALLLVYPLRMRLHFPDAYGLYLYENSLCGRLIDGWNEYLRQLFPHG